MIRGFRSWSLWLFAYLTGPRKIIHACILCFFCDCALVLRDSKRAHDCQEAMEEMEDYQPRTRCEQEAHAAYLAAKSQEKRE